MTTQAERTLQKEAVTRLHAGGWPVLALPIPNGIWIPAHNEAEKRVVERVIARMKSDGLLLPGAFDLSLHWHGDGRAVYDDPGSGSARYARRSPAQSVTNRIPLHCASIKRKMVSRLTRSLQNIVGS